MYVTLSSMSVNVEVTKNNNENPINLIRRFTKRVKGSGILPKMRSSVYHKRPESGFKKKQHALRSIEKRTEIARLKKLGKMPESPWKKR